MKRIDSSDYHRLCHNRSLRFAPAGRFSETLKAKFLNTVINFQEAETCLEQHGFVCHFTRPDCRIYRKVLGPDGEGGDVYYGIGMGLDGDTVTSLSISLGSDHSG